MNIEENVISTVHSAITEVIKAKLSGYNSPLDKIIADSVADKTTSIRFLLDEAIGGALVGDFREALKDACTRKLAKVLISKMEGEIEKRANDLRADPEFRARLTIAITDVVKEIGTKATT